MRLETHHISIRVPNLNFWKEFDVRNDNRLGAGSECRNISLKTSTFHPRDHIYGSFPREYDTIDL